MSTQTKPKTWAEEVDEAFPIPDECLQYFGSNNCKTSVHTSSGQDSAHILVPPQPKPLTRVWAQVVKEEEFPPLPCVPKPMSWGQVVKTAKPKEEKEATTAAGKTSSGASS